MDFPVAIRTQQNALIDFVLDLVPTASIAPVGKTKIFPIFLQMMKFQGLKATIIATYLTPTSLVL
jgi:hypothetical protein